MKRYIASTIVTLIAATVTAAPSRAKDVAVHVPDTLVSRSSAMAIENARNVLTTYLSACRAQDRQGLANAMTADAEIEYSGDVPGQYLAIDLHTVDACWGAFQSMGSKTAAADMWIYLTASPDVVFVEWVTVDGVGRNAHKSEQLAMVRMSAGRIAQIHDFTTSRALGTFTAHKIDAANRH